MRITLVSTYPPSKGSLNEYAYHFVTHLRTKAEVEEIILLADELDDGATYPAETASERELARLTLQPAWRFNAISNLWRIRQAVVAAKPDVVLFNIQFATFGDRRIPAALGLLTPWLIRMSGYTTVILLHNIMETVDLKKAGFGSSPILEVATRAFGTVITRLLLMSNMVAVTIPKYVHILTNKYHVEHVVLAPHGAFEQPPPPVFDLPDGALQIMTFGKFGTYKKVETLVEAFRLLQAEIKQPLELVIAGTDSPNTPGYLEGIRQRYADVPAIRFTGYVAETDVPRVFGDAAVVVFPYDSTTGSSGVLHQAGSYGKAAVLPQLGDFAELIEEEGYSGEYFQPNDARSLADAIARFINDPQHRQQVGMRNYLAASGLPMSDVVDWYLLHFERLLGQRSALKSMLSRKAL